jgi:arylsulfatase A-like enzyme
LAVGLIALLLVAGLSACRNGGDEHTIPDGITVLEIDETAVSALALDFTVETDREVHDLWTLASQPCNLESGWSIPKPRGVPGSSGGSVLEVFSERTPWTRLVVRLKGLPGWTDRGQVEIRLNGTLLGSIRLSSRWQNAGFAVTSSHFRRGLNRIEFDVVDDAAAQAMSGSKRQRRNAFQLQRLALVELPESESLKAQELRSVMDQSAFELPPMPADPPPSDPGGSVDSKSGGRVADEDRGTQPDLVVIILDAARPDHFSCYGYGRQTTPNIDRVATESLVFRNAFALVPNTRRSVPTMVTGLSFVNHQVVADSSVLSDQATTLAEVLREVGYRTACFTATPNNSRALGTDQGYGEFFEVWRDAPTETSMDPHFLASRVVEWLEGIDEPQPLHLQIHFVPPHAPYTPAPAFDVFSDPAYDGPFDGFPNRIVRSEGGWRPPSAEDLAHMIARYDGNLRAVDDAVGLILSTVRKRTRWDRTVVLVTSDHGEAFFEHRSLGHNNTVYDEMLRVPFVLRLPPGIDRETVDVERLVTLADITPTLLATSDRWLDAPTDGIDLLDSRTAARFPDGRSFIGRTAHVRPSRCLRTERWKVVLSRHGRGELYDLEADPAEQHNLRFAEPALFFELGTQLVERFLAEPTLPAAHRDAAVSQPDRDMLEALGYVN